ncbi:hypothetical protein [Aurantiacibacter aquimixticola]|uniref:Uncharacterized protein n=1 Tax=Aurantiacibacter aquimixticola TaxID=1958945 RepID=A0A419RVJ5_9SPHN|nr:hypothetical protein [Aurantiacibacter aquimixticola]RJY09809.1 hypothetical protein D6201_10990 [Aurantiacibacter aquimixticola]
MTRRNSKTRSLLLASAAALALTVQPPAAHAEDGDPFAALTGLGTPVADEELGEIRGKFLRADSISFFGISMVTSWQDDSGITTVARLVFNVDFLGSGTGGDPVPTLVVGWMRDGDPDMDVTGSHGGYTPILASEDVLPIGSLGSTNGAAQANIIAGANNSALNGMRIALVPTSQLPNLSQDGLQSLDGSFSQVFADGDTLGFHVGANALSLTMTGNSGSDSTLQSIGGDLGRMLQQTILNSDGNAVSNNAAIIIGTDAANGAFNSVRATEALSVMHGHGF